MTSSRNCELRFNLNLRSKTEMSDGAELSLLEVRLCLTSSIGFVRTNVWLGMQRSASLKRAIARTDSTWKIERDDRQSLLKQLNSYGRICAQLFDELRDRLITFFLFVR